MLSGCSSGSGGDDDVFGSDRSSNASLERLAGLWIPVSAKGWIMENGKKEYYTFTLNESNYDDVDIAMYEFFSDSSFLEYYYDDYKKMWICEMRNKRHHPITLEGNVIHGMYDDECKISIKSLSGNTLVLKSERYDGLAEGEGTYRKITDRSNVE